MAQEEARDREMHDPGDRLTRLSEASLRINESLDFDEVLQQVVDGARALTGARYGVITTMGRCGTAGGCLNVGDNRRGAGAAGGHEPAGLPVLRRASRTAEGPRLPRPHEVPGPFRTLPPARRPISARAHPAPGRGVGNIYLAREKGGPEFSREDEETLVLFASQAALVISNARRHREERRARADLEALVNTAPVGVLVFDARTGRPVSVNQEARRIIGDLHEPHRRAEELLDDLTVRRDDGREFSLQELSVAQALSAAVTVRAEEIVLTAPDGRSVTALINATPIRGEDGAVETCVVTPAGHDAPGGAGASAGRVPGHGEPRAADSPGHGQGLDRQPARPRRLPEPGRGPPVFRIIDSQTDRMRSLISDLLDVARIETGTLSVSPEPTELAVLAGEAADAFRVGGHKPSLLIDLQPDLPWVMADRSARRPGPRQPALQRGAALAESSAVLVTAVRQEFHVAVSVSDDGRGIPAESLPLLFRKFLPGSRARSRTATPAWGCRSARG